MAGPAEVDAAGIPVGFTEEGRPYRGRLDAPIVMEEFSDFQCPYCGRFTNETMPALLENQVANGEVVIIFHDFPLNCHSSTGGGGGQRGAMCRRERRGRLLGYARPPLR
ncbi:MAG: hypothetical protein DCC51_08830 [Anaerolineae bacterium]|nr:MAG: hypothetical protein DCC51_08830 [Anaerolineae bacterium]